MKLTLTKNVSNLTDVAQLAAYVQQTFTDLQSVINGNVEFIANISVDQITANFITSNSDAVFQHTLGRIPAGFIVVGLDSPAIIYNGAATNTTALIYLRSNVANINAQVMVF